MVGKQKPVSCPTDVSLASQQGLWHFVREDVYGGYCNPEYGHLETPALADFRSRVREVDIVGSKTEPTANLFGNQVLEIEIVRDFGRASARDSDH